MEKEYYDFLYGVRSSGYFHHTPKKIEALLYEATRNPEAIRNAGRYFFANLDGEAGQLSDGDLKNLEYALVGSCYYLCHFLIENGVDAELAYNSTDYIISKAGGIVDLKKAMDLFDLMGKMAIELLNDTRHLTYGYPLEKAMQYINQRLFSEVTVNEVAEKLQITPEYLTALFKKKTGISAHQYIQNKKINESKRMLKNTNMSVTLIGSALGYNSSAHFATAFRKIVGLSPREYRNQN